VLDDINVDVRSGEFVSIVGRSGCGKSTLLRVVAGLLKPTAGTVRVAGHEVVGEVPRGVALVFQDFARSLFPWMSVRANVELPLSVLRYQAGERRRRAEESLEAVGLLETADRYPWQLSGGMQQRVAIARALACEPQLLLMDEPFASVDALSRAGLEDLLLAIHARYRTTVLFVTHDIDESVYLSDRVVVLCPRPAQVVADLPVHVPRPRDQVRTRQDAEFVASRTAVATLILDSSAGDQTPRPTSTDRSAPPSGPPAGASGPPRHDDARRRQAGIRLFQGATGIGVFLLAWQSAAALRLVDPRYFPSAVSLVQHVVQLLARPVFQTAVLATLREVLAGLAIAAAVAIPVGILLGRRPTWLRRVEVLIEMLRPLPALALAPLVILQFGLSSRAAVALVTWASSWPILVNAIYGARNMDPLTVETARSLRLGSAAMLARVLLPSAAPLVATGIRIALAISISVAIAGEMVVSGGIGIGGWILREGSAGELVVVYAGAVIAGILGLALNRVMEALEARVFRWHVAWREQG